MHADSGLATVSISQQFKKWCTIAKTLIMQQLQPIFLVQQMDQVTARPSKYQNSNVVVAPVRPSKSYKGSKIWQFLTKSFE